MEPLPTFVAVSPLLLGCDHSKVPARNSFHVRILPAPQSRLHRVTDAHCRVKYFPKACAEPGGDGDIRQRDRDQLQNDLKSFRSRKPQSKTVQASEDGIYSKVKGVVDTLLLWDFFAIVGLLLWLGAATGLHFGAKNDVLLDPWLALWEPIIQPALGVLMLGAIVQGVSSFLGKGN